MLPSILWLLVVVLPVLLAWWLVRVCGAPTEEEDACQNPQRGPFRRCHLHRGDTAARDWMAVALVLLGVVALVVGVFVLPELSGGLLDG